MSTDHLSGVTDELLTAFFEHQVKTRPLTVQVNAATERRLRRSIQSMNRWMPEDPLSDDDEGLGHALMGAADRGLRDGEREDGVWTGLDGAEHPLQRAVRAPLGRAPVMMRCWRAARDMWRST